MTPEQAYEIIVNVTASVQLTRKDHETVMQALELLKPKE